MLYLRKHISYCCILLFIVLCVPQIVLSQVGCKEALKEALKLEGDDRYVSFIPEPETERGMRVNGVTTSVRSNGDRDDRYVSFIPEPETKRGMRVNGVITSVRSNGDVIIKDLDLKEHVLSDTRTLSHVRSSEVSRRAFLARSIAGDVLPKFSSPRIGSEISILTENGKEVNATILDVYPDGKVRVSWIDNLGKRVRQDVDLTDLDGPVVLRETALPKHLKLSLSDDPDVDSFRRFYNEGEFVGDDRFISIPLSEVSSHAKVVGLGDDGSMSAEVLLVGEHIRKVVIARNSDILNQVRISSQSKDSFDQRPINVVSEEDRYGFSVRKLEDNLTFNSVGMVVNLDSPRLHRWIKRATDIIRDKTGISPNNVRELTSNERHKIYKVWLEDIVPKVEDKNKGEWGQRDYGYVRDTMFRSPGNYGIDKLGLGEILDAEGAVCSELSAFGSIIFAEYGLNTKIAFGNIDEVSSDHSWIQVHDNNGKLLEIVDSNYTREVHPNLNHHVRSIYSHRLLAGEKFIDILRIQLRKKGKKVYHTCKLVEPAQINTRPKMMGILID